MTFSLAKMTQDARESLRYPTNFPGELAIWRNRLTVTITNISRRGALLTGENLPLPGQEVTLTARSLEVVATVAWNKNGAAGLRFHRDVEPLEIVRQNAAGMTRFRTMKIRRSTRLI